MFACAYACMLPCLCVCVCVCVRTRAHTHVWMRAHVSEHKTHGRLLVLTVLGWGDRVERTDLAFSIMSPLMYSVFPVFQLLSFCFYPSLSLSRSLCLPHFLSLSVCYLSCLSVLKQICLVCFIDQLCFKLGLVLPNAITSQSCGLPMSFLLLLLLAHLSAFFKVPLYLPKIWLFVCSGLT